MSPRASGLLLIRSFFAEVLAMVRWILVGVAAVALVIAITLVRGQYATAPPRPAAPTERQKQWEGPPPKIEIKEIAHDFGTMEQLSIAQHTFPVRNVGDGVLVLTPGRPTCGCQSVVVRSEQVPDGDPKSIEVAKTAGRDFPLDQRLRVRPGGTAEIVLSMRTEFKSGDVREEAPIETNDPALNRINLAIAGNIVPLIEFTDRELRDSNVQTATPTKFQFRVLSRVLDKFDLVKVTTSNDKIQAAVHPTLIDDLVRNAGIKAAYDVSVEVVPGLPVGPFQGIVTVHIRVPDPDKHKGYPEIVETPVTVVLNVHGSINVIPDRIDFKDVKVTSGATQYFRVTVPRGNDIQLKLAKCTIDFLKVTVDDSAKDRGRYLIKIDVPPGAQSGQFRGEIEFQTNDPLAQQIKVPVKGLVIRG
jgi:hypothetical protein